VGIRRRLERRDLIRSETEGDGAVPHAEAAPLLAACNAAAGQGPVALGPKAGHYVGRRDGEPTARWNGRRCRDAFAFRLTEGGVDSFTDRMLLIRADRD